MMKGIDFMKKLITFSLCLFIVISCFTACFDEGGIDLPVSDTLVVSGDDGIHTDFEGFYMTLKSVSATSVGVTWHNDTDREILFGEGYFVELMASNGKWVSVQNGEMSVPAIALMLPAGGTLDKGYSLEPFDLSRVGKYRLRSEFYYDGATYSTWVEFSVTMEIAELVNRIPDSDLSEFAKFLDREGFVKKMTQGQLLAIAEKYAEGLDPAIVPLYAHYDGPNGGGCVARGELFGYENAYYANDDTGEVRYSNIFYSKVEVENLVLPYGIKYGDKFVEVLDKMDIDRNVYQKNNLGANIENLPLYNDGEATLTLVNWALTPMPVEMLYHYELTYTEKIGTLTRTVKLSFGDGENRLARVDIEVVDEYKK